MISICVYVFRAFFAFETIKTLDSIFLVLCVISGFCC